MKGSLAAILISVCGLGCHDGEIRERNREGPFGENRLILVGMIYEYPEFKAAIQEAVTELANRGIRGEDGDSNLGITEIFFPQKDAKRASEFLEARTGNAQPRWFRPLDEWCASRAEWDVYSTALSRAQDYLRRKDFSYAAAYFTSALRIKPDSFEAYGGRARARELRGERDAAIRDYEKAAELHPSGGARYYDEAQRLKRQ